MRRLVQAASALLLVGLAACATRGLESFALEADDLHASLAPRALERANHGVPEGVSESPHLATDAEGVESIARFASQGRLGGEDLRSALFALYDEEGELGVYGLETATPEGADRLEIELRGIWNTNVDLERARVHRGGRVLLVVWNDHVSRECWRAVNEELAERLDVR